MEPRNACTDTRKRAGYRVYFDLADDISVNHVIAPKQAKAALFLQRIFVSIGGLRDLFIARHYGSYKLSHNIQDQQTGAQHKACGHSGACVKEMSYMRFRVCTKRSVKSILDISLRREVFGSDLISDHQNNSNLILAFALIAPYHKSLIESRYSLSIIENLRAFLNHTAKEMLRENAAL